jgi:hypothetical protein
MKNLVDITLRSYVGLREVYCQDISQSFLSYGPFGLIVMALNLIGCSHTYAGMVIDQDRFKFIEEGKSSERKGCLVSWPRR